MSAVIITVILLLLAAGAFIWIVNSAIGKSCPQCGPEQMIIPIIPSFLAWCPQCGQSYQQEELVSAQEADSDGDLHQYQESEPQEPAIIDQPLTMIDSEDIISFDPEESPEPADYHRPEAEEENINHGPPRF